MGISIQGPEPLPMSVNRRQRSPPLGTNTPGVVAAASRGIRFCREPTQSRLP